MVGRAFSTSEAWRGLRDSGISTRAGKGEVDAHAAAVILQGYLDAQQETHYKNDEQQIPNENIHEDDEWLN